jgi:hypothetical protein
MNENEDKKERERVLTQTIGNTGAGMLQILE